MSIGNIFAVTTHFIRSLLILLLTVPAGLSAHPQSTYVNRSSLTLSVYNILGQEVATLVDDFRPAGAHVAVFSTNETTSGLDFYRLTVGGLSTARAMTVAR